MAMLVLWSFVLAVIFADLARGTGEWSEDAEDLGKLLHNFKNEKSKVYLILYRSFGSFA